MEKLIRCFRPTVHPTFPSLALLFLRFVAGAAFILHGWGKIQNPLGWMGPDSSVPGFFQFLAAFAEFGGGIAWILGLLTPLASLGIAFTMLVAALLHMLVLGDPFVNLSGGGSYELSSVFLAVSFVLIAMGPGKFSIDAKLFGPRG